MPTAECPLIRGEAGFRLWTAPLRFLERGKASVWRYAALAWPVAMVPSLLLAASAAVLLPWLGLWSPSTSPDRAMTWGHLVISTLLAPLIETLALSAIIEGLRRSRRPLLQSAAVKAGIVALVFATLHGLVAMPWFFGTVWSFFVFAWSYLRWRPHSWDQAFVGAGVPHVLLNFTIGVVLLAREAI